MMSQVKVAMRMAACLCVWSLGTTICYAVPTTLYVDIGHPNASDANFGDDPDNPLLTIDQATDNVVAGGTVYVRARQGLHYGAVTMKTSGNSGNPITFIGYSSGYHNLDSGDGTPESYGEINSLTYDGNPFAATVTLSPTIKGAGRAVEDSKVVDFNGHDHIVFRNFWVEDAEIGINLDDSDHCVIENIYVKNMGDKSTYSGRGVLLRGGSTDNRLENCTFYNAAQQAVTIEGKSHRTEVNFCRVYSDDDSEFEITNPNNTPPSGRSTSMTHYYFVVEDSNDNDFFECYAACYDDPRIAGTAMPRHRGHAFTFQAIAAPPDNQEATGNTVVDCTVFDIWDVVLLRYTGTHGNLIDGVVSVVTNEADEDAPSENGGNKRHQQVIASRLFCKSARSSLAVHRLVRR